MKINKIGIIEKCDGLCDIINKVDDLIELSNERKKVLKKILLSTIGNTPYVEFILKFKECRKCEKYCEFEDMIKKYYRYNIDWPEDMYMHKFIFGFYEVQIQWWNGNLNTNDDPDPEDERILLYTIIDHKNKFAISGTTIVKYKNSTISQVKRYFSENLFNFLELPQFNNMLIDPLLRKCLEMIYGNPENMFFYDREDLIDDGYTDEDLNKFINDPLVSELIANNSIECDLNASTVITCYSSLADHFTKLLDYKEYNKSINKLYNVIVKKNSKVVERYTFDELANAIQFLEDYYLMEKSRLNYYHITIDSINSCYKERYACLISEDGNSIKWSIEESINISIK